MPKHERISHRVCAIFSQCTREFRRCGNFCIPQLYAKVETFPRSLNYSCQNYRDEKNRQERVKVACNKKNRSTNSKKKIVSRPTWQSYRKFLSDMSKIRENSSREILNKNYVKDIDFTFHYLRFLLSYLGLWPMVSSNSKSYQKVISKFVGFTVCSLMFFELIPLVIHTFFYEKTASTKLVLAGPIGFCLASILKFSFLILHRRAISECLRHMEKDWRDIQNENDWKIMRRNVQVGRDLTALCCTFNYSCTVVYHMTLSSGKSVNERNETVRNLVFPGYDLFLDARVSPFYEFVFYTCFCASLINTTVALTSCNLVATFVVHACGQFEIVVERLRSISDDSVDFFEAKEKVQERIKNAVKTHVRILGFSSKIEDILQETCCIEVLASTLIICLLEYYCLMEWNNSNTMATITYIGLLISLTFNLFIFCHIGELLKEQGDKVEEAAYMCDWQKMPGKTGLGIVMILNTRNIPRRITAGRMMELSIRSFANILKSTVAYFNMLRTAGF